MRLIKDIEIDFNKEEDLLNSKTYSETLKELILQKNTFNKSLVIGILGEWGSGKSSIIKTTQSLIEQDKNYKNIKFITYDAWKYMNDSFRRMFLLKIQEELKFKQTDLMERFYTNKSEDVEITHKFKKSKLLWASIIAFIISIIIAVCFPHLIELNSTFISLSAILGCLNVILNCFDNLKMSQTTPLMFAPEQFEGCFNEIVNETLNTKGCQKILKWINGKDKLVIIIDNIDRCDSDTATQLLNNVKSFLSDNPNVIFIIPTDDKSLCHHLKKTFSCSQSNAMEFLRKIFNVEIFIKPLCEEEIFSFVKKINDKYQLKFSPDALSIIADTYASNPRKIIQFFNNAQIEFDLVKDKISDEEMDMAKNIICKLLIIKEENFEYYKQILKNYHLLTDYKIDDNKTTSNNDISGQKDWIHQFLSKTSTFKLDTELLEKIISNDHAFPNITPEIKGAIRDINLDIIADFIKQSSLNKENLLDYIIHKLHFSVENNLWESKVLELFRIILFINSISELSKNINSRIERELFDLYVFCNNIKLLDDNNKDLLISYLNTLHKQKNYYLFKAIMDKYFKGKFVKGETAEEINLALNLFTKLLSISDTNLFKKYSEYIIFWYEKTNNKISELQFNDLDNIASNELIEHIIQNIFVGDKSYINEITYIIKNRTTFDNNLYEKLFEKINSIYPNYLLSNSQIVIEGIDYVFPILNVSKPLIKSENLDIFVKNLFTRINQYTTNNTNNRELVIKFLIKVYKLTENNNIIPYLLKIINMYPYERNNILKGLKDENISSNIASISEIVLDSKLYTDEYCYWLEKLSTMKDNDNYIINDKKLSIEIKNILSGVMRNSDNIVIDRLNNLLEFLLENRTITFDEICQYLKTSNNIIEKLSNKIKVSVLDRICKFIKDYENDRNILELTAKYGSKNNIKILMKFILENISNNTNNMISLYKLIPADNISETDKNKINQYLTE